MRNLNWVLRRLCERKRGVRKDGRMIREQDKEQWRKKIEKEED